MTAPLWKSEKVLRETPDVVKQVWRLYILHQVLAYSEPRFIRGRVALALSMDVERVHRILRLSTPDGCFS